MKKVLVIEDDRVSREIVCRAVERLGYVAIQSANGRHGWETLWENEDIAFVITDMAMPDMDGRELVHLIRNSQNLSEVPIIIVSGCFSNEEIQPLLDISPSLTLYMAKPLDTKLLEKYIELLLTNSSSESGDRATTN